MQQADDRNRWCHRQWTVCLHGGCPHSVCTHCAAHLYVGVHLCLVPIVQDVLEATSVMHMRCHPAEDSAHTKEGRLAYTAEAN